MRDNSTLLHRLSLWAQDQPEAPALHFKNAEGVWTTLTARDYWTSVVRIADGLQASGLKRGHRVLIYAITSAEWLQWELGVILAGGISAGMHPHLADRDLHAIASQFKPDFALVPSEVFRERLNELFHTFGPEAPVYTFAEAGEKFVSQVNADANFVYSRGETLLKTVKPSETQMLIFTSGTTGTPKGVKLGLGHLTFVADTIAREWNLPFGDGSMFSFLPLAHIAEKIQSLGVAITERYPVWFNSNFDNFLSEMKEVRPSMFLAVPRIWERFKEQIENQKPKLLQRLMEIDRVGQFAERLYLAQAREQLGLDRVKVAASGAVKLVPAIGEWFRLIGVEIEEIYGMSEACGLATLTHAKRKNFNGVGYAPAGIELKIAQDGEIWVKGPNVFNGYWEDEELTASVRVDDGWLKTGDLGESTPELKIIGRNRDIIKLSNGRMVAPLPIENALKEIPEISNVCLLGEGKDGLLALITLKDAVLMQYRFVPGAIEGMSVEVDALKDHMRKSIDALLEEKKIKERVPNFIILSREFSADQHELTLTQKLNRARIQHNFRHFIDFKFEA